ncbi:MAG: helix-turn-helix transcriptional regulator [Proteobacteria bacterium]|nr:helix-turn-helix transcriptional regulator [Pseudomonadota bacterium]
MFSDSFYKNHFSFKSSRDVLEVCRPFFSAAKLNYFDYCRIYNNHDCLVLSSDGYWLEHFFKKQFHIAGTLKNSGMHLWSDYNSESFLRDAKSVSDHVNGISFFEKHDDYIEYYDFAASAENDRVIDFYLNYSGFLKNFLFLFKEKAHKLIHAAEKNKIIMPQDMKGVIVPDAYNANDFIKNILNGKKLSKRELECLYFIIRGKSCSEIGLILKINRRTVEVYINNLKEKFNCHTKGQLIEKAIMLGCVNINLFPIGI